MANVTFVLKKRKLYGQTCREVDGSFRGRFLWAVRCKWCWYCICSNCFNCAAKLIPLAPPDVSVILSPSSLLVDSPAGMTGIWESIWPYPPLDAVLRIALRPGNSVLDGGWTCMNVYDGTVFNLVWRILNAELCWSTKTMHRTNPQSPPNAAVFLNCPPPPPLSEYNTLQKLDKYSLVLWATEDSAIPEATTSGGRTESSGVLDNALVLIAFTSKPQPSPPHS